MRSKLNNMQVPSLYLLLLIQSAVCASDLDISVNPVIVHKCCREQELLNEFLHCQHVNETESHSWSPIFTNERGATNIQVGGFRILPGLPDCGSHEARSVNEYPGSSDRLILLPGGIMRHFIDHKVPDFEEEGIIEETNYFDYSPGTYCLDKIIRDDRGAIYEGQAAIVCVPPVTTSWAVDVVVRRIVDPILHLIGIACLLVVAIVYFVIPPLRDLVGNILSTISVCLIVTQAADLVRIFTEFSSHVSFLIADVVMYVSLLSAFFWLTSLGYYIWRTFRSRNVFLRVSDGRKFCYYSIYAWGSTLVITFVALAAHFLFDKEKGLPVTPTDNETIGWLGVAMFFTPIAFTIVIDIFFYLTTGRAVSRMATYGRIHGRMKFSFALFIQLFLVMSISWLFLVLSWLKYEALVFANIVVNALQPMLILFICVVGQKSVRSLLRKGCCRGDTEMHWGEEMMSMTSS